MPTIDEILEALRQLKEIYGEEKHINYIADYRLHLGDYDIWSFKNGKLICLTEEYMKKWREEHPGFNLREENKNVDL